MKKNWNKEKDKFNKKLNSHASAIVNYNTVKPVYSGHLGEFDKMTTIDRWPL
jgi:hypothetical protein